MNLLKAIIMGLTAGSLVLVFLGSFVVEGEHFFGELFDKHKVIVFVGILIGFVVFLYVGIPTTQP